MASNNADGQIIFNVQIDDSTAQEQLRETTREIERVGEAAGNDKGASSKFEGAFKKIGGAAVAVAKASAVAFGTIATGVGVLAKQAVANYAEYEQLVGGVETLFKDSSNTVLKYANNAYKTAGLSANEYMETVTSFSASLLQSLDGDTAKAADKANLAITDMSDNANKMGTSMEIIQNAYQGFAKQNYTMLDNLKLGYGGTKAEMQRLLTDAEKLSGVHYDLSSYSDLVDAIHVVQTEMGITGTTSKEAATTIQGSIGMMKAAWTNFLTGMADPDQDFDALLGNLVDSIVSVADNLIPRIAATLPRLAQGLMALATTLGSYLPEILQKLLPSLISGAAQLFSQLITGIPALLQALLPALVDSIKTIFSQAFGEGVGDSMGSLLDTIMTGFSQIGTMLQDIRPKLTDMAVKALPVLVNAFSNVYDIVSSITSEALPYLKDLFEQLQPSFQIFTDELLPKITELFFSLLEPIMTLVDTFLPIIIDLFNTFAPIILDIANAIMPILIDVFNEILPIIGELINSLLPPLKSLFEAIAPLIKALSPIIAELSKAFGEVLKKAIEIVLPIINSVIDAFMTIATALMPLITEIIPKLLELFLSLIVPLAELVGAILPVLAEAFAAVATVIAGIIEAVLPVLIDLLDMLIPIIKMIADAVLPAITEAFNVLKEPITELIESLLPLFQAWMEQYLKPAIEKLIPIIKFLAEVLAIVLKNAIEAVTPIIETIIKTLTNVADFITNVFTKNWDAAWGNIVAIVKSWLNIIPNFVEDMVNLVIDGINNMIDKINSVTTVVGIDAIPKIGYIDIPTFHTGGIIDFSGKKEGLINAMDSEMVLTASQQKRLFDIANGANTSTNNSNITVYMTNYVRDNMDINKIDENLKNLEMRNKIAGGRI